MISAQQEAAMQMANDRSSKKRQDKTNPFVINIDNGRLLPNTPRLRAHKDYRVYTGPTGPDVTEAQRMQWLAGAKRYSPRIVDSSVGAEAAAESEPFDIGTATAADLVMFAFENYGKVLDEKSPLPVLRDVIKKAADAEAAASLV